MHFAGRCLFELGESVLLQHFSGRPTRYSVRLHDFSPAIFACYKDVYVDSFGKESEIFCPEENFL